MSRRRALLLASVLLLAVFVVVVLNGRHDPDLPFLSRYHVVHRPTLGAHEEMPPREVMWIEAPMRKIVREFKHLPASGASGGPDQPGLYGRGNRDTGEAWLVVQGQTTYLTWPDPNQTETVAGTEALWTTVLYARPTSLPFFDRISRMFSR